MARCAAISPRISTLAILAQAISVGIATAREVEQASDMRMPWPPISTGPRSRYVCAYRLGA